MMSRRTILPPGSSPLERAIDETLPDWGHLATALRPPGTGVAGAYPVPLLPWLAAEWGVAQFSPYFDSHAELLEAGHTWLLERGSAASVRRALSWLGFDAIVIEEDQARLHIDLGRVPSLAELQAVAHVVRASLPVHELFYRVFHGWDVRPMRPDRAPRLDGGLLDDDSGIYLDSLPGLKLSFMGRHRVAVPEVDLDAPAQRPSEQHISVARDDVSGWLLDAYRLDAPTMVSSAGLGTLALFEAVARDALDDARSTWSSTSSWVDACAQDDEPPAHLLAEQWPQATADDGAGRPWRGAWSGTWRPDGGSHRSQTTPNN